MKYSVANPIYDSVFKFLMEDERIAKIILTALLKKEVVSVEMRRHEHPNVTKDKISMFRIDFAAKVKENDGSVHLILIELQKTWLDTETLRFRRYLAAQYNAEENIQKQGEEKGFAVPMVAVYLLGHRVGDLDKAVVYNNNSIIVQIPLLNGEINDKQNKVLSIFDQTRRSKENQQVICVDPEEYLDDPDMMYILRRLCEAIINPGIRQLMDEEDEYCPIIERIDTKRMQADEIKRLDIKIAELDAQIAENDRIIAENDRKIKALTKITLVNRTP